MSTFKGATSCLIVQKWKTVPKIAGNSDHNFRLKGVVGSHPEKESENDYDLIPCKSRNYVKEFENKVKEVDGTIRADAVKEVGIVLKVCNKGDDLPPNFDLEKWKKDSVKWIKDNFGDNCISAVFHADEEVPHIHAVIVPIVNGRLSAYQIFGQPEKLSEMQTSYYEAIKQEGISRGQKGTKNFISYKDTDKLKIAMKEKTTEDILPEITPGESVTEYKKRADEKHELSVIAHFAEEKDMAVSFAQQLAVVEEDRQKTLKDNETLKEKNKNLSEKLEESKNKNKYYEEAIHGYGISMTDVKNYAKNKDEMEKKYKNDIEKSKEENEKLTKEVIEKDKMIEYLKSQLGEAVTKNQRYEKYLKSDGMTPGDLKRKEAYDDAEWAMKHGFKDTEILQEKLVEAVQYARDQKTINEMIR